MLSSVRFHVFVLFLLQLSSSFVSSLTDTVTITVTDDIPPLAIPIAPNFVSLSTEISDAVAWFGPANDTNIPFRNLMQNLQTISQAEGPMVRIGGGSADFSVFDESNSPLPPNQTYRITRQDLYAYAAALPTWNGRMVLDTSLFFPNDTYWPTMHAAAVTEFIGWDLIDAVEIGNEVETYHDSGVRPRTWMESDYETEFVAHVNAMENVGMPRGRIQGMVLCCNNSDYNAAWPGYAQKYGAMGWLTSMSYHHYAVGGCEGKGVNVTVSMILADNAAVGSANFLLPYITSSRAAGIPFRIGEGNSVSCGGRTGVSDAFASSLWSVDMLLELAKMGVSMVNFHGGGSAAYSAVTFPYLPHNSTVPDVRPLYYGMWFTTYATQNNSLPYNVTTVSTNSMIKTHALKDSTNVTRVVVIHKDINATGSASITVSPTVPDTNRIANLLRLETLNNNVSNRFNVTFMNLTYDGTIDGLPSGTPYKETVTPNSDGSYSFILQPCSAVILEYL